MHSTNGYHDSHINGLANGTINGPTNGHINGNTNGHSNGFTKGTESTPEDRARLIVLSSFDEVTGKRQVENLQRYLEDRLDTSGQKFLNDLAYTLNERRTHHIWKTAIVARSAKDLAESMKRGVPFVTSGMKKRKLGFVFTGQGAQWSGMGKELISTYPIFRASLEKSSRYLKDAGAAFDVIGRHFSRITRVALANIDCQMNSRKTLKLLTSTVHCIASPCARLFRLPWWISWLLSASSHPQ